MELIVAETRLHRLEVAIDALTEAKKAVSDGFGIGIEHVDQAIKEQKAALLHHVEEAANVDWWNVSDIPRLASIMTSSERFLGLYAGGPVIRLGIKVGKICERFKKPSEAAT